MDYAHNGRRDESWYDNENDEAEHGFEEDQEERKAQNGEKIYSAPYHMNWQDLQKHIARKNDFKAIGAFAKDAIIGTQQEIAPINQEKIILEALYKEKVALFSKRDGSCTWEEVSKHWYNLQERFPDA